MVLLFNTAVFLVVLVQLRHMRANRPAGTHSNILKDLRGVASITFLLGLTWCLALFAWEPAKVAMLYLFSILNSLQGFFIFLFHCLMKENVRKQWRVHLCFGRFRIQDYSGWAISNNVLHLNTQRANGARLRPFQPSLNLTTQTNQTPLRARLPHRSPASERFIS
uniref:G-protein coupled receptors family 2 profile 2 domain-containing protein n=1 Tax=Denticeps clupeoides TaxID=299321 RepID=A0AAY4B070_9TELE